MGSIEPNFALVFVSFGVELAFAGALASLRAGAARFFGFGLRERTLDRDTLSRFM